MDEFFFSPSNIWASKKPPAKKIKNYGDNNVISQCNVLPHSKLTGTIMSFHNTRPTQHPRVHTAHRSESELCLSLTFFLSLCSSPESSLVVRKFFLSPITVYIRGRNWLSSLHDQSPCFWPINLHFVVFLSRCTFNWKFDWGFACIVFAVEDLNLRFIIIPLNYTHLDIFLITLSFKVKFLTA